MMGTVGTVILNNTPTVDRVSRRIRNVPVRTRVLLVLFCLVNRKLLHQLLQLHVLSRGSKWNNFCIINTCKSLTYCHTTNKRQMKTNTASAGFIRLQSGCSDPLSIVLYCGCCTHVLLLRLWKVPNLFFRQGLFRFNSISLQEQRRDNKGGSTHRSLFSSVSLLSFQAQHETQYCI